MPAIPTIALLETPSSMKPSRRDTPSDPFGARAERARRRSRRRLRSRHGVLPDAFSSTNSTRQRSSLLARARISARFLSKSWTAVETRRYPTVPGCLSAIARPRSMKMRLLRIGDIVRDGFFNAFRFIDAAPKTSFFFEAPGSGFARPERGRKPLRKAAGPAPRKPGGVADPALSERGQPYRVDEAAEPPLAACAGQGLPRRVKDCPCSRVRDAPSRRGESAAGSFEENARILCSVAAVACRFG